MISARTQLLGVIGTPIRHSLSPTILNAAFAAAGLDWAMAAFEVADGDAARALDGVRALGLRGLSVTMPHKEPVAAAADELSEDARLLGAANCVVNDGERLTGHSTDGPGLLDALRDEAGFDAGGCRAVVVGAGGAARAVVLALGRAGATDVAVVNRSPARAEAAAGLAGRAGHVAEADSIAEADLVVNATPLGMTIEQLPIDPQLLGPRHLVADLVYHPATTPLLVAARERGARAVNGLGMLVHQAGHAFRLWTAQAPPLEAMAAAARAALSERD